MKDVKCEDCAELKNEWCKKKMDSPYPDILRDCQYFHEKKDLAEKARQLVDLDEIRKYPIRANHHDEKNGKLDFVLGIEALMEYIESLPTVEADYDRGYIEGYTKAESDIFHGGEWARVKHGHWIGVEHDGYADGNPVYNVWECSECHEEHYGAYDTLPPYCKDCGTKMDLEEGAE